MASKPKRPRTERREALRSATRLGKDRERLFTKEPGGSPERPLLVESASVVEVRARSVPCPRCGGDHQIDRHDAVGHDGDRLRVAHLVCRRCGTRRSLWFRLPVLN